MNPTQAYSCLAGKVCSTVKSIQTLSINSNYKVYTRCTTVVPTPPVNTQKHRNTQHTTGVPNTTQTQQQSAAHNMCPVKKQKQNKTSRKHSKHIAKQWKWINYDALQPLRSTRQAGSLQVSPVLSWARRHKTKIVQVSRRRLTRRVQGAAWYATVTRDIPASGHRNPASTLNAKPPLELLKARRPDDAGS